MSPDTSTNQAREQKLSAAYAEFIDLNDEDLEEVTILEYGYSGGSSHYNAILHGNRRMHAGNRGHGRYHNVAGCGNCGNPNCIGGCSSNCSYR